MDKYISVLCIFLMSTGVHSLQCYSCNNCTKVESSHLVTCGSSTNTTTSTTTSSTTTISTTTTTTTTTANPSNTTATVNTTQSPFQFDVLERKERFIENTWEDSNPASEDNCFCKNGFCNCLINMQRAEVRANDTTFVCVTDTINLNGLDIIRRDCAAKQNTTQLTCQRAGFFENCKVCETDGCNLAISVKFSTVLVISALILTFTQ